MKKLLIVLLLTALLLPAARADTALRWIDGGNADRVHLRAAPDASADSLGLYFTGTGAILLEERGGWAHVMLGAVEGWMMADYLSGAYIPLMGPGRRVENPGSTWVNLRTAPSLEAAVAMRLPNGRVLRLLGETADGWSYVEGGGAKGYIMTSLLSEADDQTSMDTTVLGMTAELDYIHQYNAPNGQNIYFTAVEEDVYLTYLDVNFDGVDDIVVDTVRGASNVYSEFFVFDSTSGQYVRAAAGGSEDRLCNYGLHPEYGLVSSYNNAGNAGLLHTANLYRWEGNDLRLIRSAVSDEWAEESFVGSTYTSIVHGDILHMSVRDRDGSILWEIVMPKDNIDYESLFEQETEALWQGIR